MDNSGNIKFVIKDITDNKTLNNNNKKDTIIKTTDSIRKGNRCDKCNKKLPLTAIKCKCDKLFCNDHRYSDTHDCTYDYKKKGKEFLEKNNPSINFSKVDKI